MLVTGTTGFVGKALMEKLLFSLPNIKKIYILIRAKKGSKLDERFKKEVLESPCFDRLRERHGSGFNKFIEQKVHPMYLILDAEKEICFDRDSGCLLPT